MLTKPLSNGDVSVVLFNENSGAATISTIAAAVGKTGAATYTLDDLWTGASSSTSGTISASVPGHGVVMYRVSGGRSSPSPSPSGSGSPGPSPSSSSTGVPVACRVSDVVSAWGTGLTANITITNSGRTSCQSQHAVSAGSHQCHPG
ncbi:hypothetical protein [Dactylosporangium sp. NPDC049140]|uniref:hypothetical protein n=1 Tax=Dactylosporangium sp. NPDC049140 TaxID=3155647 RepID=UPI00340ED644